MEKGNAGTEVSPRRAPRSEAILQHEFDAGQKAAVRSSCDQGGNTDAILIPLTGAASPTPTRSRRGTPSPCLSPKSCRFGMCRPLAAYRRLRGRYNRRATGVPGFFEVSWNGIDGVSAGGACSKVAACPMRIVADLPAKNMKDGWNGTQLPAALRCQSGAAPALETGEISFPVLSTRVTSFLSSPTVQTPPLKMCFVEGTLLQGWGAMLNLVTYRAALVGTSQKQVVERPLLAIPPATPWHWPTTRSNFFEFTSGSDGAGDFVYAGTQTPATCRLYDLDDGGDQNHLGCRSRLRQEPKVCRALPSQRQLRPMLVVAPPSNGNGCLTFVRTSRPAKVGRLFFGEPNGKRPRIPPLM